MPGILSRATEPCAARVSRGPTRVQFHCNLTAIARGRQRKWVLAGAADVPVVVSKSSLAPVRPIVFQTAVVAQRVSYQGAEADKASDGHHGALHQPYRYQRYYC